MSTYKISKKLVLGVVALGITVSACGSGDTESTEAGGVVEMMVSEQSAGSGADDRSAPAVEESQAGTETPVADMTDDDGLITRWEDVTSGVVQIVAEGDRVELQSGQFVRTPDRVGTGTGFLVEAGGVIVTNNHVVTGASSVQVLLPDEDRPRNARVLGASECWDLAVIQLVDEGDYPYFGWSATEPPVATEVYAIGFPLSDPEVTVTRGIVSKQTAFGQTDFASVDDVLETDAVINPGNSGGPLVTPDGTVVGINFAGNESRQGFAIKAAAAMRIINELKDGNNVDYIGLNAVAVQAAEPGGLPLGASGGLFVRSVATGSDAFDAGVQPGEVILEVDGTHVGENGLMTEYCDILRTKGSDGELTLTTWNPLTGDIRTDLLVTRES